MLSGRIRWRQRWERGGAGGGGGGVVCAFEAAAVAAAAKANERKLRKSATDKARRVRQRELAAAAEIARAGSTAR
jgi:hypothetical protein